jgi:hypothetical protein
VAVKGEQYLGGAVCLLCLKNKIEWRGRGGAEFTGGAPLSPAELPTFQANVTLTSSNYLLLLLNLHSP